MMKHMRKILILMGLSIPLAACGEAVQVPPATEGKILTSNGYLPDTIPPSRFRLAPCLLVCDKIILIEKSDQGVKEAFRLFMPKDQLNVNFDLRMTASIQDNKTDAILNRVQPVWNDSYNELTIGFNKVYDTYAQPIIRDAVRSVVSEYSIGELSSNRDIVNAAIAERLKQALSSTPIALKQVGLADIQFPEVITKQKEIAAERRVQIEQQEAKKQIRLIELQTDLEAAKAERAIRRERAEAAAEENEIAAQSVTPEYLEYKRLEVMSAMAENRSSVFVPFSALDEVGLSQKVFNNAN